MTCQSKTTVAHIFVTNWREHVHARLQWRLNIAHAVAVQIAEKCHMDIASIAPYTVSLQPDEDGCYVTVVYNNNGYSLDDIYNILKPEEEHTTDRPWRIINVETWQGLLDCGVAVRDEHDTWD